VAWFFIGRQQGYFNPDLSVEDGLGADAAARRREEPIPCSHDR
jgi:hypothetical protein